MKNDKFDENNLKNQIIEGYSFNIKQHDIPKSLHLYIKNSKSTKKYYKSIFNIELEKYLNTTLPDNCQIAIEYNMKHNFTIINMIFISGNEYNHLISLSKLTKELNKIDTTIIGTNRYIRSDEWLVNTPYAISQQYNDYKYFSNLPRSTKTDMFSTIFVPVKDILVFTRPFNIGYLILGEEYGLSFYWYGRLIALLLVTFELMML